MVSKFTELVIDCREPEALASFWSQVLGYEVSDRDEEMVQIKGPEGSGPTLLFIRVPEKKSIKNRLHIDVNPSDRDQQEEVNRLEGLGARRIDIGQGEVGWVVMADPEGNEFCVLRTRV